MACWFKDLFFLPYRLRWVLVTHLYIAIPKIIFFYFGSDA